MTGYDIYKKSCSALGYFNLEEGHSPLRGDAAKDMINQICGDLKLKPIKSLSEELSFTQNQLQALIYGLCMLLSTALRDSDGNGAYSRLYKVKRATLLAESVSREDVLPKPSDGGL